ncbi:alpha/beta fold hydrolase [Marinicauda algicola]|uniref:Proline iminopeptidase n=2 Tax=Marinicauda algicola TaxID=2029849 RepID=A0A4S2H410_9PROT|nr:alpha/beta fold hydrolase [Marinicauda algicola]TGY90263.1 alpha/beta fold hydrolase [Marinicauda algicola]
MKPKLIFVLLGWLLVLCAPARAEAPELAPCEAAGGSSALCGLYPVYENRAQRVGRMFDLNIMVLPATEEATKAPVFFLTGGPGEAATDAGAMFLGEDWSLVRRERDIVLVDQRGTGRSNRLDCPVTEPNAALRALNVFEMPDGFIHRCLEQLAGSADVRHYTTPVAMDDLDEVRAALGYDRIVLYGASYGTRAAFVYMRRHPQSVESVVLRAIAPVNMRAVLPAARHAQNAFEGLVRRCRAEAECAARHGDLEAGLDEVLARLEREPAAIETLHPFTGEAVTIVLTRDIFAGALAWFMAAPQGQDLVAPVIAAARTGDYAPFLGAALPIAVGATANWSLGMALTVICNEDMRFVDPREIEVATAGSFMGGQRVRNGLEACSTWPDAGIGLDYLEPVRSDLPVLMISGEYDPIDGLDLALDAERYLTDVRHIIIPGGTHQPQFPGCTMRAVQDFLGAPGEGVDACQP